jgi:hypothetical protein
MDKEAEKTTKIKERNPCRRGAGGRKSPNRPEPDNTSSEPSAPSFQFSKLRKEKMSSA